MTNQTDFSLPDKKIPAAVMIIGTFQLAVALWLLVILVLIGRMDGVTLGLLALLALYGALGAGLWAIQEWARFTNIVLHVLAIPYTLYLLPFWGKQPTWPPVAQLLISFSIIIALTRPKIRHKFQTVVPKQKNGKSHQD